jgi:Ca2+-binding RTX toxin-like protein
MAVVYGTTGNDNLQGGSGADTMSGGLGNDVLVGAQGDDDYIFNLGDGFDRLYATAALATDVDRLVLGSDFTLENVMIERDMAYEGIVLRFSNAPNDRVLISSINQSNRFAVQQVVFADGRILTQADLIDALHPEIRGTAQDDILTGLDVMDDIIYGDGGQDYIKGAAGDDILDGGAGNDFLIGGGDVDVDDAAGHDTFRFGRHYGQDIVWDEEAVQSMDTIELVGLNRSDVTLSRANLPPAYLDDATDTLRIQILDSLEDELYAFNHFSTDTTTGYNQIERITFADGTWMDLVDIQNAVVVTTHGNDTLIGYMGQDILSGGAGNDTLEGRGGDDRLDGGVGADTMIGGAGHDTYVRNNTNDVIVELANEGMDTVESTVSYTLGNHIENARLMGTNALNATGNDLANLLEGNQGVNLLNGKAGDDTVYGYTGDDQLLGDAGNDWLYGGDGADRLDGGVGADHMIGGVGNDLYIRNNSGDVITELANEGIDTVESAISYTLGDHLEHVMLTGVGAISATGNTLDNHLTGNNAANVLDGRAGRDVLLGGLGNDSYRFKRNYGQDLIIDVDSTLDHQDQVLFGADIDADQVWFSQLGNDLVLSIIGTTDQLTIQNWYSGAANHIEQLISGTHLTLNASNVQYLVDAMSSLTPPVLGQTELSAAQHSQLDTVIAANWI